MTVSSTTSSISYAGDGVTLSFAIPFNFLANSDIQVAVRNAAGDTAIISTGFTVTGAGTGSGTALFTTAPAAGTSVILARVPAILQPVDFVPNDKFPAETNEQALDRETYISQMVYDIVQRCVRLPFGDASSGAVAELPAASNRKGKVLSFNATTGAPETLAIASIAGIATAISASIIGALLYPINLAETAVTAATGFAPTNLAYPWGNAARYGILPNSAGAASANTTALSAILSPLTPPVAGRIIFPNTTGADTYYLNNMIQVCDKTRMDLQDCTLNFSKSYAASDDTMGFFTFIRDVTIENGSIVVNYTGSGANNPGPVMRIGSRVNYKFGSYTSGIFDQDDLIANGFAPMGGINLRNLRITSNNPNSVCASAILMLGGLQNVTIDGIAFNGNGAASAGPSTGIYYEFGYASKNGFPGVFAQYSSSHAQNLKISNITGRNMFVVSGGYLVDIVEAFNVIGENISSDSQYGTFEYRIGEAHFFRPWTANAGIVKRNVTLRNITAELPTGIGINLNASAATTAGYLSDANMTAAGLAVLTAGQKVDLMKFSLDGFAVNSAVGVANGVKADGAFRLANGVVTNCFDGIVVSGEASRFELHNVESYGATDLGVRASIAPVLFAARRKSGTIVNSKVCGGAGVAIAFDYMQDAFTDHNQIGYNTQYDDINEATQTVGINWGSNCLGGVISRSDYITTSGGANAYSMSGTNVRGCTIISPRGMVTVNGPWMGTFADGLSSDRGDANVSLVVGQDSPTQQFATNLTANRTVTLSTAGAYRTAKWRIVRTGLGAFTLNVGGLKTIPAGTAAFVDVMYDGAAWFLTAYGTL